MNDSQIALMDAASAHIIGEPGSRFGRAGEHHDPADRPVEPMNESEEDVAGLVVPLLNILLQDRQDIRVTACILLARHIGRLHRNQYMIVFVQDGYQACSSHRPKIPAGNTRPDAVTGSPISPVVIVPPKRRLSVSVMTLRSTDGEIIVV